jgi:nucleoside-diphosphate-sugar epimerase
MGYGYAKLCAGQMTRDYAHQLGMRHIWMRILSVYGPNDGEKTLIMSVLNQWKKNEIPEMTKGEQMWDYLYSGDAARAFRMVGESGVDGKVYVLGSGQARALVDYIREMRALVNLQCDVALGVIPYAPKQVMYLCADITELTEDTGWHPLTEFSDGITHILQNEDEKEW